MFLNRRAVVEFVLFCFYSLAILILACYIMWVNTGFWVSFIDMLKIFVPIIQNLVNWVFVDIYHGYLFVYHLFLNRWTCCWMGMALTWIYFVLFYPFFLDWLLWGVLNGFLAVDEHHSSGEDGDMIESSNGKDLV